MELDLNFLFQISHDYEDEVLKIGFYLPFYKQNLEEKQSIIEIALTTGVYIEDSLEFGKFELRLQSYEAHPEELLRKSNISHQESRLDITFPEFINKMDKQYVVPYFNVLKLYFNNSTTYTPTTKEKERVSQSYNTSFIELEHSLAENMSFLPYVSHAEIKNINEIIDSHARFKSFTLLNNKLPAKHKVSNIKI